MAVFLYFLGSAIFGAVAMAMILSMRRAARAFLFGLTTLAVLGVAIDGPAGFMRWFEFGLVKLAAFAPWLIGFALGSIIAAALNPASRRNS